MQEWTLTPVTDDVAGAVSDVVVAAVSADVDAVSPRSTVEVKASKAATAAEARGGEAVTAAIDQEAQQQQQQQQQQQGQQAYVITSAHNGLCLTIAGDLQVFAAPLLQASSSSSSQKEGGGSGEGGGGSRATVVLFNRSPTQQPMAVRFADLATTFGDLFAYSDGDGVSVRDLWLHQDLGVFSGGVFETTVESHAVVHVNLEIV
jgi:hypothetical protein